MKKLIYVFTKADTQTRLHGIIALALAFLAIVMLITSAYTTINGSLVDIAIVEMVIPEEERDDLEDAQEEALEILEEAIENDDEAILESFEDANGVSAEKFVEMIDTISLSSVKKLTAVFEDDDEADEVRGIVTACITVITVYACVLALMVALSALFMVKGWFIASTVLALLFFFIFSGIAWFLIYFALCVAFCILAGRVKKRYSVSAALR